MEVQAFARVDHEGRTYDVTLFVNGQATVNLLTKTGRRWLRPQTKGQKARHDAIVRKAKEE